MDDTPCLSKECWCTYGAQYECAAKHSVHPSPPFFLKGEDRESSKSPEGGGMKNLIFKGEGEGRGALKLKVR